MPLPGLVRVPTKTISGRQLPSLLLQALRYKKVANKASRLKNSAQEDPVCNYSINEGNGFAHRL